MLRTCCLAALLGTLPAVTHAAGTGDYDTLQQNDTRRISGRKRMMRASTPHSSIRLRMKLMPLRCRMEERNSTARKMSTPFRRFVPLVVFSRVSSL